MSNNSQHTLDLLKATKASIEDKFIEIDKILSKIKKSKTFGEKKDNLNKLNIKVKDIFIDINYMKTALQEMKGIKNKDEWEKKTKELNDKSIDIQNQINEIKTNNENKNIIDDSSICPDDIEMQDIQKLSKSQIIQLGDKANDLIDDKIKNIGKLLGEATNVLKETNKELEGQKGVLKIINQDLDDIDYSLKKAYRQIIEMLIKYSTDPLIVCLIAVIVLIIITIIIVSAFGENKNKNFNLPYDFLKNNKNTNTSQVQLSSRYLKNINILGLIILYILYF